MTPKPSYLTFKATQYAWKKGIDYRRHPELYSVGKGEQGVLICQPPISLSIPKAMNLPSGCLMLLTA